MASKADPVSLAPATVCLLACSVTGMVGLRYVKAAAVILIIIQAASIHQAFTVAEKEAAKRRRME